MNLNQIEDDRYFDLLEKDPPLFIEDVIGEKTLEGYQTRIGRDIFKYDKVAIRACHSVGKTWLMARIALWFFSAYRNSIVITTAPTHRQVKILLWGELRDAHKKSKTPLAGRLLDMELKVSDKHYAIGFSPEKKAASQNSEQQGSSFQGFHSDYVLVIFDEATGVSPDVWIMAQGLLTSGIIVKFVAIANPTTKNCVFYNCFSSPDWHKVKISCFDSPNLLANGFNNKESITREIDRLSILSDDERLSQIAAYKKPVPYLLSAQFVISYGMELGVDHPLFLSKCLAEFPLNEENVFVQFEDVVAAQERTTQAIAERFYIGVDVARYGEDKTVITELDGYVQTKKIEMSKRDINEITGAVVNILRDKTKPGTVLVDCTGLGAGVYDSLVEKQREGLFSKDILLIEIHFGSKPYLKSEDKPDNKEQNESLVKRFFNLKSRMFDLLGKDTKEKLCLLNESIYQEELPTIKYSIDSKGKIVVESKKDYKARTKRPSPDSSDSLALANFGRYVTISYGSFKGNVSATPLVKRTKTSDRKSRIKVREY